MREIKFRAWDDRAKNYFKVCRMGFNGFSHDFWSPNPVSCDFRQADEARYIFEQYTGLKDKNGREIYEGDIVVEYSEYGKNIGAVIYDPPVYAVVYANRLNQEVNSRHTEVIGNIHENPELLA
ncbi:MAG: hypothetical protein C0436_00225 [Alphaproteobacteria bacterium]|nr:hypothetical protein [Alphaproteobacteria bacterium]